MITESAMSAAVLDPKIRAKLRRFIAPTAAICRKILDERPDVLCVVLDSAGDVFYLPADDATYLPADRTDVRVGKIVDEIRSVLPGGDNSLAYCRLSVQRHVATISEPKVPHVPVLTRRTDEDDGGDYAPIRTVVRTIGIRIPDGVSVFVGVRKGLRGGLSAHQRVEL